MKKGIKIVGVLAVFFFLLSVLFKSYHLIGAPALLAMSFVLGALFLLLSLFNRFKK